MTPERSPIRTLRIGPAGPGSGPRRLSAISWDLADHDRGVGRLAIGECHERDEILSSLNLAATLIRVQH